MGTGRSGFPAWDPSPGLEKSFTNDTGLQPWLGLAGKEGGGYAIDFNAFDLCSAFFDCSCPYESSFAPGNSFFLLLSQAADGILAALCPVRRVPHTARESTRCFYWVSPLPFGLGSSREVTDTWGSRGCVYTIRLYEYMSVSLKTSFLFFIVKTTTESCFAARM